MDRFIAELKKAGRAATTRLGRRWGVDCFTAATYEDGIINYLHENYEAVECGASHRFKSSDGKRSWWSRRDHPGIAYPNETILAPKPKSEPTVQEEVAAYLRGLGPEAAALADKLEKEAGNG